MRSLARERMSAVREIHVLVVDDDVVVRSGLRRSLEGRGFVVDQVDSWAGLRARYEVFRPHAIVMDHHLGDGEGVALLADLRRFAPTVPVVILTGHGSIDLAVQAMRGGAEHFLTKPVEPQALEEILRAAVRTSEEGPRRVGSGSRLRVTKASRRTGPDPFLGDSDAIRRLREQAEKMRDGDRPVLILGETGTGKSVLARWIHESSARADAPFVDLNCAALTRELLDSELFGHERGAFTGAQSTKMGLLEAADRGTLFLDEIGDMDIAIQPKLLKALEEKRFRRLGDVRDRAVDVRLVSATHQDLGAAVRARSFRADLYYRVSAMKLVMPPLRARREDVPVLARDLLERLGADLGRAPVDLTPAATAALQAHDFPGNVRELKNVLDRALCLSAGDRIDVGDLIFDDVGSGTEAAAAEPGPPPLAERPSTPRITLKEIEVRTIESVLREEGGRVEAAAKRLGIPRSSLYHKLKTLGLKPARS